MKEGGEKDFEDAHCDDYVGPENGDYGHVAIQNDTTTELEVSNAKTKDKTTIVEGKEVVDPTADSTPSKLHAVIAGVTTEITCNKAASATKEGKSLSTLHNVQTEGKHTVTGTVQVNFTECTVDKPLKCIVTEPIVATATFVGVEGLKPGGNDMGVEFDGEGPETTIAELVFHDKSVGEKCAISNGTKPFKLKGSLIATSNVAQGNQHTGATAVHVPLPKNPATAKEREEGMQTLEMGGKQADFTGTFTTTMFGTGGNPITLTTVT